MTDKNQIKKIIILILIFAILWKIYCYIFRSKYSFINENENEIEIPKSIKCFFGEENCEEGNIDSWTLFLAFIYFVIGLIIPNQYLAIIIISIIFEFIEPVLGNRSKFIIGPLANLTGYTIGSLITPVNQKFNHKFKEKYQIFCQ